MPRCTLPGHVEFRHGQCVMCRRKRQRQYQAELRSARNELKAIRAILAVG